VSDVADQSQVHAIADTAIREFGRIDTWVQQRRGVGIWVTGSERYPRLAGQPQAYIVQQLADFKSGTRSNDRAHVMRAVAGRLTDEEIRAIAEYLAGI
jgi:DNA-binding FadR family transcriptional regulator